jgi:hypothetical protein
VYGPRPRPDRGLKLRPVGCAGGIFGRKHLGFFHANASRSSSTNFLVSNDCQSRCCAPVWGNDTDCHCIRDLGLRLILEPFFVVRVCRSAGSSTC